MGNIKEINTKNQIFFNDMINIKNFYPNLPKIDKLSYKKIDIYLIGYVTIKDTYYVNLKGINPLYLIINKANGNIRARKEMNT